MVFQLKLIILKCVCTIHYSVPLALNCTTFTILVEIKFVCWNRNLFLFKQGHFDLTGSVNYQDWVITGKLEMSVDVLFICVVLFNQSII